MEEKVLNIIKQNCPDMVFDVNSNFTVMGVDSITFIKIIVALEQEFGFEFDDEMLLFSAFPTIETMINYVINKAQGSDK
jgi:acyl carrier protein